MAVSTLRYDEIRELGRGGMAKVVLYREKEMDRFVAIKMLSGNDEEKIKRFKREASLSLSLKQENLPAVYDYFINSDNTHCLVMEYVEGVDLSALLKSRGKIPPHVAAMIIRETARGLEYLHERGILHRDIKPSNVRLTKDGQVILMDFGIAKREDQDTRDHLTSTGVIIGTPSYMSPEQASGDRLSYQSDIFSLGTMLYEILCGSKPFQADTNLNLITLIAQCRYKPLYAVDPQLPSDIVRIAHTALARDLNKRYLTAGHLIKDLNLFLENISQFEMRRFMKKYFEAATGKNPKPDWSFFNKLPHLDSTIALSAISDSATKQKIRESGFQKLKNRWVIASAVGVFCFLLGLSFPYLKELLKPVQQFGTEPYGTVNLKLTCSDPARLQDTKIYIENKEYARKDNLDDEVILHYFKRGVNSLKIQFPLIYQTYDYRFYFEKGSDARNVTVDIDSLVNNHNQKRSEGSKYGFSVQTEPRDMTVSFEDIKNFTASSPMPLTFLILNKPSQKIIIEKSGFKTDTISHQFENDKNYLIRFDPSRDVYKRR